MAQTLTETKQAIEVDDATYQVVVEWDGGGKDKKRGKPPTKFYQRAHELGFIVRGSLPKSESPEPLARRLVQKDAGGESPFYTLVINEGAYITNNKRIAERLAAAARDCGAPVVIEGRFLVDRHQTVGDKDVHALKLTMNKEAKRGRRFAAEAGRYVVTCLDELQSYAVELDEAPTECPICRSYRIIGRKGNPNTYLRPKTIKDTFDFWRRTRFSMGHFEIPRIAESGKGEAIPAEAPPSSLTFDLPKVNEATLPASFKAELKKNVDLSIRLYDVLYRIFQRGKVAKEQRIIERDRILSAYIEARGEDDNPYRIVPPRDGSVDIIDLCHYEPDFTRYL